MIRHILYTLFAAVMLAMVAQVAVSRQPFVLGRFMLAQVGVSISTPANPYNSAARQLQVKEQSLLERENSLREQEALLDERIAEETRTMRYLLLIASSLFGLILVNFYLDWRKRGAQRVRIHKIAMPKIEEVFRFR
ncbi:MAG: hypothetical protein Q8Q39_05395 [bacterium]|nr:hypothetical protein [bacterium]